MSCLALADGEGRNGVWLAQQRLQVHAVDASPVGLLLQGYTARQLEYKTGGPSNLR